MDLPKAFHILNPNKSHRRAVERFFQDNPKLEYMWVERVSHPTHLETVIEWAVNEGRHSIAIWGGDGTFSRAVNRLSELNALDKMAVSLIAVGTCNDLARKLKLPNLRKMLKEKFVIHGKERPLDVGLLATTGGNRTFINNGGFGRDSAGLRRKSNPVKDILSFTPKQLDLEWEQDGARHFETRSAVLGVVCNAPFFNGAMHFDKNVEPDDGVLSAFLEGPQPASRLFCKLLSSRLGRALMDQNTFRMDGTKFRVESNSDLYPQVDGEPATKVAVRKLEFSILPQKLRLYVWS